MRSTFRRRRDPSQASFRCSGRPLRGHWPGPVRSSPPFVVIVETVGVRVQRSRDELLGDVRAVAVGRVDEVDAELDRAPQHRDRGVVVARRAPDALAGDPHRAEAEAVDLEVAADRERRHVASLAAAAGVPTKPFRLCVPSQ